MVVVVVCVCVWGGKGEFALSCLGHHLRCFTHLIVYFTFYSVFRSCSLKCTRVHTSIHICHVARYLSSLSFANHSCKHPQKLVPTPISQERMQERTLRFRFNVTLGFTFRLLPSGVSTPPNTTRFEFCLLFA